ncbi:MAG: MBL fold metallo-hydrolase [Fervidicoccaceae archaeon]
MMKDKFVDRIRIRVLADNQVGFRGKLLAQHGASYFLEASWGEEKRRILVDTGWNGEALLFNMKMLEIDPKSIDAIVITHGHWDHTGGLLKVLEKAEGKQIPIVMHPLALKTSFISEPFIRPVGILSFSEIGELKRLGGYPILSRDPVEIAPGILTTGEIERRNDFETVEEPYMFVGKEGELERDIISDDIALVIKFRSGIGIVTGCGHSGIINILEKARALTGETKIKFIIGGLHLAEASDERIIRTVSHLSKLDIDAICAGHCTGLRASCELLRSFGTKFKQIHVGMSMEFS